ncbi:hypothetical protein BGW41_004223 [Actinomortierella wolfii]|nr:hypothetical protein BGW41_004223 [Actinomortierella wolfii]
MLVLIVGSVGLGTNLLGLALFHEHGHAHGGGGHSHGHSHSKKQKPEPTTPHEEGDTNNDVEKQVESKPVQRGDLNMHGIFLHVLGDALGSVGVIVAAVVMLYATGEWRYYVDPIMSLIIVAIITYSSIPLVRTTSFILLQGVPMGVEVEDIREQIKNIADVISVHDLHIWQLTSVKLVASLHVVVTNQVAFERVSREVKKIMHRAGVHSTTIQPEFPGMHNEKDARKIFPSSALTTMSPPYTPRSDTPFALEQQETATTVASTIEQRLDTSDIQVHEQPADQTMSRSQSSNPTIIVMDQNAASGTAECGVPSQDDSDSDSDYDDSDVNCRLLCIDGEDACDVASCCTPPVKR